MCHRARSGPWVGAASPYVEGATVFVANRPVRSLRIVGDVRRRHGFAKRTIARSAILLLLCGAVVVGILGMHSFVVNESHASTPHHSSSAVADSIDSHAALGHEAPASDKTGGSDSLAAVCGGAMLACLTILVALGAYVVLRRAGSRRVLWTRPRAFALRLGHAQRAFQAIAPLQRSCIIRC